MSNSRHLLYAAGMFLMVILVGGAVLVFPSYKHVQSMRKEILSLNEKVQSLDSMEDLVVKLKSRVDDAHFKIDHELKEIPENTNVAELMRRLSLHVDGATIYDQTFTAGSVTSAINDEDATVRAIPLSVDMEGVFDSVFALIQAAESTDRLIRVTSVSMNCERDRTTQAGSPYVVASIGLEAIFDPGGKVEGDKQ